MTNILLVDDRPENLLALEAILDPLDQNLLYAHSGEEALRQLLRHDVAVILLDVQMPVLDGFETAMLIKQRERTKYIPIIFVTAISKEDEHVFRGYSAGAVDYVFKPFSPDVLRSKVAVFIWFGTDRGVCRYDRESFRATTISGNLQSNYVRSMLQTVSGDVWSGTNRGLFKLVDVGASTAAVEVSELQTRSVYDLFEDEAGAVWAGTNNGLFVKAKTSAVFSRVAAPPETSVTIGEDEGASEQTQPEGSESARVS